VHDPRALEKIAQQRMASARWRIASGWNWTPSDLPFAVAHAHDLAVVGRSRDREASGIVARSFASEWYACSRQRRRQIGEKRPAVMD
jgi:hypothetical protein